jgi:hypothetical protein
MACEDGKRLYSVVGTWRYQTVSIVLGERIPVEKTVSVDETVCASSKTVAESIVHERIRLQAQKDEEAAYGFTGECIPNIPVFGLQWDDICIRWVLT